jgi:hypothetical protein
MRGKAPPIDITLSRAQRLHKLVYKEKRRPDPTEGQMAWLRRNCFACEHRNVERMVTSKLLDQDYEWKHICCHRGPTRLLPLEDRKQGGVNCSGFESALKE